MSAYNKFTSVYMQNSKTTKNTAQQKKKKQLLELNSYENTACV